MNKTINILLVLIFIFAGFSQLSIGYIRPSDILLLLLLLALVAGGYFRISGIFLFILFSVTFAFIIGGISESIHYFTEILSFAILFSLINYFKKLEENKISDLLKYFNYSLFFSNLVSLIILIFIPQFRELVIDSSSLGFRLKGFFGQANGYALILLISLPISVYFLMTKRSIINILITIVSIIALLFTQSRGAILGLILSIVTVYVYFSIYNNPIQRIKKVVLPGIFSIIVVASLFLVLPEFLESKFGLNLTRINPLRESTNDRKINSFSAEDLENDRFYLIEAGLTTLLEHPLGLGYQEQHIVIGKVTGVYNIPHNYFITILLNYGFLFGAIWLILLFYLIRKGFKKIKNKLVFGSKNLFMYLHIAIFNVYIYYFTHSPEWIYLYLILAIYISFLFRKNTNLAIIKS